MWVGVSCNLILVSCIGKRWHTHIAYRIIALNNSAVLTVVCIRVRVLAVAVSHFLLPLLRCEMQIWESHKRQDDLSMLTHAGILN